MANKIPRVPVREQDPKVRATNFEEVCYGYDAEEAMLEASRCLNCKNPRCVGACPVSVKIPQFIQQVASGDFAAAVAIIAEDSSLPEIKDGKIGFEFTMSKIDYNRLTKDKSLNDVITINVSVTKIDENGGKEQLDVV